MKEVQAQVDKLIKRYTMNYPASCPTAEFEERVDHLHQDSLLKGLIRSEKVLELRALTMANEDWGTDYDDFYVSFQADIGPSEIVGASDLFTFKVVSPKRLSRILERSQIEIGRGYLIMIDFDIGTITATVERLIKKSEVEDIEECYKNLSKYFYWEMDK